jgi:hypothetical protein
VKRVALRWEDGGRRARRFPAPKTLRTLGSIRGQQISHALGQAVADYSAVQITVPSPCNR